MENVITIGGEEMFFSVKAYELIQKFKRLERENRKQAKAKAKYSNESARLVSIAEAYSTAVLLFADAYGKPKQIKEMNKGGAIE